MSRFAVCVFSLLLSALLALGGCIGGDAHTYRNEQIGWQMPIPDNAERMGQQQIEYIRQQGKVLIGTAAQDGQSSTQVESLLWYRFDKKNMFSSNLVFLQDITKQKYREDNEKIHELIKTVLEAQQVPHQVLKGTATVGGLTFETFTVEFRNKKGETVATQRQYKRFFGNKELSVTISYSDPITGQAMTDAWLDSQFSGTE